MSSILLYFSLYHLLRVSNAFSANRFNSLTARQPYHHSFLGNGKTSYSHTFLNTVKDLLDELTESASSETPRTIFFGGKGGVGKTSISSSFAVSLASNYLSDLKILVVSTDPAHSLGDALDVDLKSTVGRPTQMTDPLTMGKLYAMEIDTDAAFEKFQNAVSTFEVNKLSQALGLQPELLEGLGLSEFNSLLSNPPPGLDELVALSSILNNKEINEDFDVVVVDTAPTGHTLRMLALPEFLDGFLGKLLELRKKLSGIASMFQSFMGGSDAATTRSQTIDDALNTLEGFREQMGNLSDRLRNRSTTEFVIVAVPTALSVNESKRLLNELSDQGVRVSNIVINQYISGGDINNPSDDLAIRKYYERRRSAQDRWVMELKSAVPDICSSQEYKQNGEGEIEVTEVPLFDVELIGTPALGYLGKSVYSDNPKFDYLMKESGDDPKFIICGGKGGVGKTTTSSSLAISMASSGRNVALVSTDPAHSLGDAFDYDFTGGDLVNIPMIGASSGEGSLSVLEIDPSKSLGEFKGLIDNLIGKQESDSNGSEQNGLRDTLKEIGDVFDTLPAGTDEVVALAKVIELVGKGGFDRIVLDTAPTGHTLRMLSTPGFISELIEKVLAIAQKINSNPMIKMMISNTSNDDMDQSIQDSKRALLSFQFKMYDLEDIFSNATQTEFLIVTIPTELAIRESIRLLNDLTFEAPDMPIKVRNIIVNQVLDKDGGDALTFLNKVAQVQESSIKELEGEISTSGNSIEITKVPYLDTEPRGVFGLKALSEELMREGAKTV